MKKLKRKSLSVREETFALASSGCVCLCSCPEVPCNCPIAPTHQVGLNGLSANDTVLRNTASSAGAESAKG